MTGIVSYALVLAVVFLAYFFSDYRSYPVHRSGGILVTGASSGIGRHAAISLAKDGYLTFAGVRKDSDFQSILDENIPTLLPIKIDVTNEAQVKTAAEKISTALKRKGEKFVALVNNAGMAYTSPVELMDIDAAKYCFDVNYFGVVRATKVFLPLLREAGRGSRIVHISSVAGLLSSAAGNPYSATKFALESLNDALRLELEPWGISSSVVNPAFVSTKIFGKLEKSKKKGETKYTKEQRELYGSFLEGSKMDELSRKLIEKADSPVVTTAAITHAIKSTRPKVRYVVANVDGVPAWVLYRMKNILPERILDAIILSNMGG